MQQNPPELLEYVFAWGDVKNPKASFARSEWNRMERNEKNIFPFPCLGVLMEEMENSILFESLSGREWNG